MTLCEACGHLAHWRECRAVPEPVGCACQRRGPSGPYPTPEVQSLIDDAAEAVERFGEDELERFAEELRKRSEEDNRASDV